MREKIMAVVSCASCRKKISDKAKECSHCGLDLSGLTQDKQEEIGRVSLAKRSQSLMNHSFIAMLLFCGGFLFMFVRDYTTDSWQYQVSLASAVLGFILYIITRVRLVILKHQSNS
jgi:hypothetical protein